MISMSRMRTWNFQLRPSQGVFGTGNNVINFKGTGNTNNKNEGNRRTNVIFGSREHRKLRFDFGEQGKKLPYFRGTRKQIPIPIGRPYNWHIVVVVVRNWFMLYFSI